MKKVAYYTLGCKLNFSETSTISRQFQQGGYVRAQGNDVADVCVINTCSVTADADKKCRNTVRKAIKENPGAVIAVTGCYAQLKPQEVAAIEGVDLVLGNNDKGLLFEKVDGVSKKLSKALVYSCSEDEISSFFSAFSSGDRTRAFLKVQDGCDYHCSYCTIPKARGASRNAPISQIIEQAEQIAAKGLQEVVLTGVNIGDFGRSTGESFIDLLKALDRVEGIKRYRISSIEPNLLTDEVIDFCAESAKFQPHFHIPLQAGSNKVLGLMRRRYTVEKFAERISAVRVRMPLAFIGIDVIVGFPGETKQDFEDCYEFLKSLKPSYLHIFPYSERPDTPAINFFGKVFAEESKSRVQSLGRLSGELYAEFCSNFIGSTALVLMESTDKNGMMHGFTEHYIKVEIPYDRKLVNQIVSMKMVEFDAQKGVMRGEIIAQY